MSQLIHVAMHRTFQNAAIMFLPSRLDRSKFHGLLTYLTYKTPGVGHSRYKSCNIAKLIYVEGNSHY